MKEICSMESEELQAFYDGQIRSEQEIGNRVINYIDDGANINAKNVESVIARIKEKLSND